MVLVRGTDTDGFYQEVVMWGRLRMQQQWDKVTGEGETQNLKAIFELGLRKGSLSGTHAAYQLTSVTHTHISNQVNFLNSWEFVPLIFV